MSFRWLGKANSTVAEVETASLALRGGRWPRDFEFRGAYSAGCVIAPGTVGGAFNNEIALALRVAQPGGLLWFRAIIASYGNGSGTAGVVSLSLLPCKNYIAVSYAAIDNPSGLVSVTPTPLQSNMPASLIGAERGFQSTQLDITRSCIRLACSNGSTVLPLTAGQRTVLPAVSTAIALSGKGVSGAGWAPLGGLVELFRWRPGDMPFICWENEGFEINLTVASSLPSLSFNLVWEEYTRRW